MISDPAERIHVLNDLCQHEGFKVLCELHAERVTGVEGEIFADSTQDSEVLKLRERRAALVANTPLELIETALARSRAELRKLEQEARKP